MQILDIELPRNGVWARLFQITDVSVDDDGDESETPRNLMGATFDMDVRVLPGAVGPPIFNAKVEPINLSIGEFEIEIKGSDFDGRGSVAVNYKSYYDLKVFVEGDEIILFSGTIILTPGVSR